MESKFEWFEERKEKSKKLYLAPIVAHRVSMWYGHAMFGHRNTHDADFAESQFYTLAFFATSIHSILTQNGALVKIWR